MDLETKERIKRMTKKSAPHYWSILLNKKQREKDERHLQFLPEGKGYVKEKERKNEK